MMREPRTATASGGARRETARWRDEAPRWNARPSTPILEQRKGRTEQGKGRTEQGKGRTAKAPRKPLTKRQRAIMVTVIVALVVCALSSVVGGALAASAGMSAYHRATDGMAHLKEGEKLLQGLASTGYSVTTVQQARSEFAVGQSDFNQVGATLNGVPGSADAVPFAGSKLKAVRNLSSLAGNFSQIGISACDALVILLGAFSNPFGSAGSAGKSSPPQGGLTAADLTTIQSKLTAISALLNDSTAQLNALQPGDLSFDPSIGAQLDKIKTQLPTIQADLQEAQAFLGVAPTILGIGTPTNYLVELLDSTELRPGGGFIGNIGVMTLGNGILSSLHVEDVDLLDRPFQFAGGTIQLPTQYQWFPFAFPNNMGWSVRDSNLDADFPTDARNAQTNYRLEGGTVKTQGVISITPWVIQKALAITGPIYVPEFKETVTPSNLVNLIHLHQLGPGHGSDYVPDPASLSSQRKKFTAFLFDHFMARVKQILSAKRSQFVRLALDAFSTKDVQIFFNNSVAEQILQKHSYASMIEAPTTGDSLLVVDANVIANKANDFISYTMTDKVSIDANGVATHKLTLAYNWPVSAASSANDYGSKYFYRDYVRVYVPPQASLLSQSGWAYNGQSKGFGRLVFAGYLSLWYGGSQTITLSWKTPNAAVKSGSSWTYQELVQHQAGNIWTASMQLSLPSCGKVTGVTAPWKATTNADGATFKGNLTVDETYTTTYSCAA
jgi:hypothetical protein